MTASSLVQFSVGVFSIESTTITSNGALRASNFKPNFDNPSNNDPGTLAPSKIRRTSGGRSTPATTADRINIDR